MENIFEFNEFINTTLDEDYKEINDNFSSEFFDYDEYISEKLLYDEEILSELKRIKPYLREGKQWKNITRKYFELETAYMTKVLLKDKNYVNEAVTYAVDHLTLLNEDSDDYSLNEKRKTKISLLESYRRKQVRKINKEIKEMADFYLNNPKILIN